jgi:putative transposase
MFRCVVLELNGTNQESVSPKVRRRRLVNDTKLADEIKQQVSELPGYGYRRVWALLGREREIHSLAPVNVKRV